jgi:quercetin dioxygenase-like cupin family protein
MKLTIVTAACLALGAASAHAQAAPVTKDAAKPAAASTPPGSLIEHDADVAKEEPGTHGGGGMSTGYNFFAKAPGLTTAFRKRALHPGAGIGYHQQREDEIYYVLSGRGEYTLDGVKHEVKAGDALLTRTGSSHGIKVLGNEDLVLIITYQQKPRQ